MITYCEAAKKLVTCNQNFIMVALPKGQRVTIRCDSLVGFTPVVRNKSKKLGFSPIKAITVLGDTIEIQGYEPRIGIPVNKVAPSYGSPLRSKKVGTLRRQKDKVRPNAKGKYHQQKEKERKVKKDNRTFGLNTLFKETDISNKISENEEFCRMIRQLVIHYRNMKKLQNENRTKFDKVFKHKECKTCLHKGFHTTLKCIEKPCKNNKQKYLRNEKSSLVESKLKKKNATVIELLLGIEVTMQNLINKLRLEVTSLLESKPSEKIATCLNNSKQKRYTSKRTQKHSKHAKRDKKRFHITCKNNVRNVGKANMASPIVNYSSESDNNNNVTGESQNISTIKKNNRRNNNVTSREDKNSIHMNNKEIPPITSDEVKEALYKGYEDFMKELKNPETLNLDGEDESVASDYFKSKLRPDRRFDRTRANARRLRHFRRKHLHRGKPKPRALNPAFGTSNETESHVPDSLPKMIILHPNKKNTNKK